MRRRFIFSGRVQGVGFRATARDAAGEYRVTGWVRNEPDRSVMLEAQGEPAEIDRFIADLARRMHRNISATSSFEVPDSPSEHGFSVLR